MINQVLELSEILISEATGPGKSLPISKLDPTRTAFTRMKAALIPGGLDRMAMYRESLSMLRTVQSSYSSTLTNVFNQYQAGAISSQIAMTRFRTAAQLAFRDAFQAGTLRAGNTFYKELGLTGYDKRFGSMMRNVEAKYFKGLMGDIKNPDYPRGRLLHRLGMYKQALNSQYWNGYVAGLPQGSYIAWLLGSPKMEHCPDCESLQANSPYLREALPTVPKAGETACLTVCYCSLKEITRDEAIQSGLVPPGVGITRDESLGRVGCTVYSATGEIIGGDIAGVFNNMFNEINRLRQLIELDVANVEKYIRARSALVKQSRLLAETYNVRVIPKYAVKDLVTAVRSLSSHGWELQQTVSGFSVNMMVNDVHNTFINAGIVTRIEGDIVYVRTLDGEIGINPARGLVFTKAPTWSPSGIETQVVKWGKGSAITGDMWHGTSAGSATTITAKGFSRQLIGQFTDCGLFGRGFYFTPDKIYAGGYSRGGMLKVRLNVRNPLRSMETFTKYRLEARAEWIKKGITDDKWIMTRATELIKAAGYDCVQLNVVGSLQEICVFDAKNIMVVTN